MSLPTTLCTSCGQTVECQNAPHTFCANSHTLKADSKKLPPTPKGVAGDATPPGPVLDSGLVSLDRLFGGEVTWTQGGPWWTAVDAAIDRQQEAQLLNSNEGTQETSSQVPLFPPTPYPRKP